jgi:hypothetical protein
LTLRTSHQIQHATHDLGRHARPNPRSFCNPPCFRASASETWRVAAAPIRDSTVGVSMRIGSRSRLMLWETRTPVHRRKHSVAGHHAGWTSRRPGTQNELRPPGGAALLTIAPSLPMSPGLSYRVQAQLRREPSRIRRTLSSSSSVSGVSGSSSIRLWIHSFFFPEPLFECHVSDASAAAMTSNCNSPARLASSKVRCKNTSPSTLISSIKRSTSARSSGPQV